MSPGALFGPIEVADPTWRPATLFNSESPFGGSDAGGNVLLGTISRDSSSDDQFAVLERCGSAPVTWKRTVLTDIDNEITPVGLRVAANGTAMAIWGVSGSGSITHYSSVRPPGGTWGPAQVIVSDQGVNFVSYALGDNGDAVPSGPTAPRPSGPGRRCARRRRRRPPQRPTAAATPTATATATASATPEPSPPLPLPAASPTPTPPAAISAIADFTTLPAASRCVKGRKLTLRFKTPPKGHLVKTGSPSR